MYWVYVLENAQGKHYIGSCEDIKTRLNRHNENSVRSTKNKGPFRIIYKAEFATKLEARKRENELKSYKDNAKFKKVVELKSPSSSLV